MALRLPLNLDFRRKSALELRGREMLMLHQFADRVSRQLGSSLSVERTPREVDSTARSQFDLAVTGRGKARLRGAMRVPQAIGALVIGSGLFLMARAAGPHEVFRSCA